MSWNAWRTPPVQHQVGPDRHLQLGKAGMAVGGLHGHEGEVAIGRMFAVLGEDRRPRSDVETTATKDARRDRGVERPVCRLGR
jgi:hypothetical protein